MKLKHWLLVVFVLFLIPSGASAQAWSGIITPPRAIDWSNVGAGTIPARTTICATFSPGATLASINAAIASCPANETVYLNAGTYNFSGEFVMKSNVTLRGAGPDQTQVNFSAGSNACSISGTEDVCFAGAFNWSGGPQHLTTWTAGYAQGTTTITLGSTSGLSVGQVLILDQANDTSDTGNIYVCDTTSCSTEGGSPGRTVGGVDYNQQEYKLVTGIAGNQVTISPGIYMPNWRSGQSPSAWWATTLIQNAGLEGMTLNHTNSNNLSGVVFFNAYKCWLQNVRSIYAINSNGGGRNHVWIQYSTHLTVRDSYFFGTRDAATLSYGVEPWQSGDLLIENNIFQQIVSPLLVGNTEGSVFGYNFSVDDYYFQANWNMPGPSFTHDAGVSLNLFEGNQGTGMVEDNIHGTHNLDTYFRNLWFIRDDTAKTLQTIASEFAAYNRYMNVIGNVMGESGYSNTYQVVEPTTTNCNTTIYLLGWDGDCVDSGDGTNTPGTMFRWGNYDTVNGSNQFNSGEVPSGISPYPNSVPASHTLPASFYLSAQPPFWGPLASPWPPVGPDVTGGTLGWAGHAYLNPAHNCYLNVMGGSAGGTGAVLTFNANSCYVSSAPAPPTNVTVTVQ